MKPMLHKEQLEQLIDAYGLKRLLETLAHIAYEKASHIEENWQDNPLAKMWADAGATIEVAVLDLPKLP